MKDWVDRILAPYYVQICKKHELQVGEQKMVLLLDCWAVHRGKEFRAFMEKNHPYVLLLYVPAGCTSIYQPADVAIQRPLKARFARSYHEWAIEQVKLSLDAGVEPTGTKFDVSIGTLRAKACEWMWNAHVHVADNPDLIRLGWSDCGLLDAWKFEVQKEALLANEEGKLFKEHIREQIGLEVIPISGVSDVNESLDNVDLLEQEDEGGSLTSLPGSGPGIYNFTQDTTNQDRRTGFQASVDLDNITCVMCFQVAYVDI
ncbi:hypothetical protein R1sor_025870 [Riccia sorocarpa]|uniref:DDE-1 domain-containing protein n=1 Tax=Riccia sorocarpa TaxID=122646 RepID=A0ABD3GCK2_9MARC